MATNPKTTIRTTRTKTTVKPSVAKPKAKPTAAAAAVPLVAAPPAPPVAPPKFVPRDEPKEPKDSGWQLPAALAVVAVLLFVGIGLNQGWFTSAGGQQNAGIGVGIRKADAAVYKEFADDCAKERGTIYDNWPGLLPGQKHCNRQATWSVDPR